MSTDRLLEHKSSTYSCSPYSIEQTKTRWSAVQVVSGTLFIISVLAVNTIYLGWHSRLNTPFFFMPPGLALFILPPMAVAISAMIFLIASSCRRNKPGYQIEWQSLKNEIDSLIDAKNKQSRPAPVTEEIEVENPPEPDAPPAPPSLIDPVPVQNEVVIDPPQLVIDNSSKAPEEIKQAIVVAEPPAVKKKINYTDKVLVDTFILPAYKQIHSLLRAILIANCAAQYPKKDALYIKRAVNSEIKELDHIYHSLLKVGTDHFNDMRFAKKLIKPPCNDFLLSDTSLSKMEHPPLTGVPSNPPKGIWKEIFSYLSYKELSRLSRVSQSWRSVISEIYKSGHLTRIWKEPPKEIWKEIFSYIPYYDLLPLTGVNKAWYKVVTDAIKEQSKSRNNDFLLYAAQELKKDKQVLATFQTLFKYLEKDSGCPEIYEGIKQLVNAILKACDKIEMHKMQRRFCKILVTTISSLPKDEIHSILTDLMDEREKELDKLENELDSCKDISANFHLIAHFPNLADPFRILFSKLKARDALLDYNKIVDDEIDQCQQTLRQAIDAAAKVAHLKIPPPVLKEFFLEFMKKSVEKAITFVEEEPVTGALEEAAKGLNSSDFKLDPERDLASFDLDEYLFTLGLFRPMASIFFDNSLSDFNSFKKLYVEDKRVKDILSFRGS